MKVVILAGGYGTRISEESHLRPKPMIEIGGFPILWHIMKFYSHHGINDFVICCGYKGYMIKEYFADYYLHCSDITFDFSNGGKMEIHSNVAEPWRVTLVDTGLNTMTGGRIKRIEEFVKGQPFLMTYGDGVSDINISELIKVHKGSGKTVTLTAVQPAGRYGLLDIQESAFNPVQGSGQSGTVFGFREKAPEDGSWINAGFMVIEPEVFNYIEGDSTTFEFSPLERLSAEGKLGAYQHHGFWACMDTQRDKNRLEEDWKQGKAKWKVWE